jgi:hypothetical protein
MLSEYIKCPSCDNEPNPERVTIFISIFVGALSLAACLPLGRPLVTFFHGISISVLSQNTFNDFINFSR